MRNTACTGAILLFTLSLTVSEAFSSNGNDAAAPPPIEWEQTHGGRRVDWGRCVQQTPEGGYIMAGAYGRYVYTPWQGLVYLLKLDASGNEEWARLHGIATYENLGCSVSCTSDGGYIVAGYTGYTYHYDAYILRTDSLGAEKWTTILGEFEPTDQAFCVQQTTDGGFIVTGWVASYGAGSADMWLVKLDGDGDVDWMRTFGGIELDGGDCVQQTADGGYILTGYTESFDPGGNGDVWLVKTDAEGNELWNTAFGGSYRDWGKGVLQTSDGGFVITGSTSSYGAGDGDVWLIKTDASGKEQWSRTFGGSCWDEGKSVVQTADGGYFITGDYTDPDRQDAELYMVKTDAGGIEEWSYIIDHGNRTDSGSYGIQTTDGGYLVTGETGEYMFAAVDALLIKLKGSNSPPYAPHSPSPPDSATDVGIDSDLTWIGGDPNGDAVTYDVYFGVTPAPPLVEEGLSDALYDPGILDPSRQYFWRVVAWDIYGATAEGPEWSFTTAAATAVSHENRRGIGEDALCENYPNPFVSGTMITFRLPATMPVTVAIYDASGKRVRTLISSDVRPAGVNSLSWDGKNEAGDPASTGSYFCRLEGRDLTTTTKMVLLR
jgi:hypothetical protein